MHSATARFRYHGIGGSLFGLMLVNSILTVLTLGIYSFWAKTKLREFHYSHTEADGDRFAYHGTGGELFRGMLRAFGIILVLSLLYGIAVVVFAGEQGAPAPQVAPGVQAALTIGLYTVIAILATAAVNLSRRYRLSRSSWRGIRFSFHGSTGDYMKLTLRGMLLSLITLGLYTPYFQNQNRAFLVNNARFGAEPFSYDGDGRALFGEYLKALLLTIPTLGLSWIWYAAFKHRFFWSHTRMRGARFVSTVTGRDLLGLYVTSLLLVVCTFGIGTAWAITRTHAFWCDNLRLAGTVEWASIEQRAHEANALGEGLADALDMDVGIGL